MQQNWRACAQGWISAIAFRPGVCQVLVRDGYFCGFRYNASIFQRIAVQTVGWGGYLGFAREKMNNGRGQKEVVKLRNDPTCQISITALYIFLFYYLPGEDFHSFFRRPYLSVNVTDSDSAPQYIVFQIKDGTQFAVKKNTVHRETDR